MPIPAPLTWEETLRIITIGTLEELSKLGRSDAQYAVYMEFRDKVLKEYKTMIDFIRENVYKSSTTLNEDGKKVAALEAPPETRGKPIWRANDFPYWFEPGVEHHVIWCTEALPADVIQGVIAANRGEQYETAFWVNPEVLQSIPGLWHVHVLSRPKSQ